MDIIYRGPDGRELTLQEAVDLIIRDVRIDVNAGTITLDLID